MDELLSIKDAANSWLAVRPCFARHIPTTAHGEGWTAYPDSAERFGSMA
jgi:hypothetical protein